MCLLASISPILFERRIEFRVWGLSQGLWLRQVCESWRICEDSPGNQICCCAQVMLLEEAVENVLKVKLFVRFTPFASFFYYSLCFMPHSVLPSHSLPSNLSRSLASHRPHLSPSPSLSFSIRASLHLAMPHSPSPVFHSLTLLPCVCICCESE